MTLQDLTEGNSGESWLEYLNYNIESLNESDELIRLKVVTQSQSRVIRAIFEDLKRKAFSFGLNHGDLSLKNVIVDESGKVTLLDWGSAEASIVPHHEIIEMLKMNILENDPDGAAIQSFLVDMESRSPNLSRWDRRWKAFYFSERLISSDGQSTAAS